MCMGIWNGDVAGVNWLRGCWSKREGLSVRERVEGDDGVDESSVSETYPNCPLLGFL
jgi:hypothetical protein